MTTLTKTTLAVHVRWMISRDMPAVLAIENTLRNPWSEDEFQRHLRERHCIGMVVECGERVVGFFVYYLRKGHMEIANFAVAPEARRRGVGRQMANHLKDKCFSHQRSYLLTHLKDDNLTGHLFLKAMGWVAESVVRGDACDFYEFRLWQTGVIE